MYVSRKIIDAYLLKHGVSMESIKQMSDREVGEYLSIFNVLDEMESEQMQVK
jgi:hypothetical protein